MRTRRSASPAAAAAAAASGDAGGGILASIPSLPSSSSRPSARRSSSRSAAATSATERTGTGKKTVKNDGTTRRLRLEDEGASTSTTSTGTGRSRPASATKTSNGKAKAQRSASGASADGPARSRQATKSSTSKMRPPVAPAPGVSSSQNPTDRRKASSTSTKSSGTAGKKSQATPSSTISSKQRKRTTPSLKVSAKENTDDAVVADADTADEGGRKAETDAGASDQTADTDTGDVLVDGSCGSKGPGPDDVPGATNETVTNRQEQQQPEATDTCSSSKTAATTSTADASKKGKRGLPPKPTSSTTTTSAGATNIGSATGATANKRKAPPSKSTAGGKPPTPRSTSSNGGRTKPPLSTVGTVPGSGASASTSAVVRNRKPPTPRSSSSGSTIAGYASAGDDDKAAAGATKRTTFLSGYNLDCTKTSSLLDLPDPPTPEDDDGDGNGSGVQDRKAKRRRRMSTGAAAFGSRRNFGTPGGSSGAGTGDDAGLDNGSTSGRGGGVAVGAAAPRSIVFDDLSARARRDSENGQRRKVRNSLCHVPSPAETPSMPNSTATGTATFKDCGDAEIDSCGQIKKPVAKQCPEKESSAEADSTVRDVDVKSPPLEKGGICFDDDDDDANVPNSDDSTTKKRRKKQQRQRSSRSKKRQSVFLPSDFMHLSSASGRQSGVDTSKEDNDTAGFYSDLLSYKASATSTASADSSMSLCSNASIGSNADADGDKLIAVAEQPSAPREDPNTSNLLLQAVREICSLPESKRYDSDQAGVVELLGGYPYIPPAEKERARVRRSRNEDGNKMRAGEKGDGDDLNWTFSPSTPGPKPADDPPMSPVDPIAATLEKRRELILTLGPVVERMEAKRKEDTEAARQATGCRVSRTKKGRYKYYDLGTEEEVSPEEYKRRYFAMIRGNRKGDQDQSIDTAPPPESEEENANVAKEANPGDTRDLQEEDPDQESSTHDMSIDEDGDDMDISLMSTHDKKRPVEDVVSKDAVAGDMGNGSVNENDSLNIESNAGEAGEEKIASPAPAPAPGKPNTPPPSSSSTDFILPLPDRGDPDTDPQIAAAERRLWSDIDAALARYSRDVISIRAARKMGFTLSQTAESP